MLIKGWKPVTKKILGIIVPAVLAGIALALALFRLSLAGGDSVTSMALVPAAAGLMIAHIVWERPRRGETLLLAIPLILLFLGALSSLPLISRAGRDLWRSMQPYLNTPYAFTQFKSIGVTFDICLIAAYAGTLVLAAEAVIGKDFLSRFVSFIAAGGFIAYAVFYLENYGDRTDLLTAACSYLPHILLLTAVVLLCLRKPVRPEPEPEGEWEEEEEPDREALREELLELKRRRDSGGLGEEDYARARGKILEKI